MTTIGKHEEGAALLAVLLLVVVVGAIAAAAMEKLSLSRAVSTNAVALDQTRLFAAGLEQLAALTIDDLVTRTPDKTTLAGGWNGSVRRVPMPGGGVAMARVRDGGNCFNLNSVAAGDPRTGLTWRPSGVLQLAGLISGLGVPEVEARRIAAGAGDRVDSDSAASTGGTERADSPNTLFENVGELRAVDGMTPETYAALRPWLCVLPVAELSPLNVNTLLPHQAPLLAMLAPGQLDPRRARAIIESRPASGWDDPVAFWLAVGLRDLVVPLDVRMQPQVRSRWFALEVRVFLMEAEFAESALIDARLQPSRLVARRWEE